MRNHTDCKRQFIQFSRAWYRTNPRSISFVDEINVGFYHKDGGTTGEFTIRWVRLGGKITPMLTVFDDAWDALWQFRDVLEKLAKLDSMDPTPERICQLLLECGVEDNTPVTER